MWRVRRGRARSPACRAVPPAVPPKNTSAYSNLSSQGGPLTERRSPRRSPPRDNHMWMYNTLSLRAHGSGTRLYSRLQMTDFVPTNAWRHAGLGNSHLLVPSCDATPGSSCAPRSAVSGKQLNRWPSDRQAHVDGSRQCSSALFFVLRCSNAETHVDSHGTSDKKHTTRLWPSKRVLTRVGWTSLHCHPLQSPSSRPSHGDSTAQDAGAWPSAAPLHAAPPGVMPHLQKQQNETGPPSVRMTCGPALLNGWSVL